MAIVIPKHAFSSGQPMDKDQINENFETVVEEMQGALGEHNWKEDAFSSIATVDEESLLHIYRTDVYVDHGMDATTAPASSPSLSFKVSNNHEWVVIKDPDGTYDPMELTIITGNSILWVMFSFQQEPTRGGSIKLPGCTYAIALDGAVIPETIIGTVDRSNDRKGESVAMTNTEFTIDCAIPVTPGSHTIAAVARMVSDEDYTNFDSTADFYEVFNRELIAIEMK